ncbi:MAG: CBS domain-containing protein [Nitrospirota bacterium]|nr:CBS domain-containing protein [Nitrospirota bacterium]
MLIVKDVLTRHVITAHFETTVRELAEIMKEKKIGSVFITDDDGLKVGIVTESDIVRKVVGGDIVPYTTQARQIMSSPLITIDLHANIYQAQELMDQRRVLHLAVTDGDEFAGMISIRDLIHPYEHFERGTSWV